MYVQIRLLNSTPFNGFEFSKLLFSIITSVYTYAITLHTRKHDGVRMETLLIQQTEKSNKFWKIVVKEKDYVVFYGKLAQLVV